jgi:hypothetical protein
VLKTYSPQTQAAIRATADVLARSAIELIALADAMKDLEFDELQVTHGDQRKRCMECADNFVAAVKVAIREAREKRGDFGIVTPTNHKKKKKK